MAQFTQLRAHEGWASSIALHCVVVGFYKHFRDAKIDNLTRLTVVREKNVVRFDVTVYNAIFM